MILCPYTGKECWSSGCFWKDGHNKICSMNHHSIATTNTMTDQEYKQHLQNDHDRQRENSDKYITTNETDKDEVCQSLRNKLRKSNNENAALRAENEILIAQQDTLALDLSRALDLIDAAYHHLKANPPEKTKMAYNHWEYLVASMEESKRFSGEWEQRNEENASLRASLAELIPIAQEASLGMVTMSESKLQKYKDATIRAKSLLRQEDAKTE